MILIHPVCRDKCLEYVTRRQIGEKQTKSTVKFFGSIAKMAKHHNLQLVRRGKNYFLEGKNNERTKMGKTEGQQNNRAGK